MVEGSEGRPPEREREGEDEGERGGERMEVEARSKGGVDEDLQSGTRGKEIVGTLGLLYALQGR